MHVVEATRIKGHKVTCEFTGVAKMKAARFGEGWSGKRKWAREGGEGGAGRQVTSEGELKVKRWR